MDGARGGHKQQQALPQASTRTSSSHSRIHFDNHPYQQHRIMVCIVVVVVLWWSVTLILAKVSWGVPVSNRLDSRMLSGRSFAIATWDTNTGTSASSPPREAARTTALTRHHHQHPPRTSCVRPNWASLSRSTPLGRTAVILPCPCGAPSPEAPLYAPRTNQDPTSPSPLAPSLSDTVLFASPHLPRRPAALDPQQRRHDYQTTPLSGPLAS